MDENLFDELEITLPGHKKRLRKAGNVKTLYILFTWPIHDIRTLPDFIPCVLRKNYLMFETSYSLVKSC